MNFWFKAQRTCCSKEQLVYLSCFSLFSFLRVCINGEQARARSIRARIQLSPLLFHLNSRSYVAQSQKVTKEVRQDSECPPPTRLACLCRPAVDGHVHCGETMTPQTHVHSDLETLPSAAAPPFRSATHHQVHRNNCTDTNRRSFGRARVFPSAVMVYTYTQVISSGVGVRWEAFLTLSSQLHSLSLHCCQGHFNLESIVASSDAAEKHRACTRGSQANAGERGSRPRPAGFTINFPHVRQIASLKQAKRVGISHFEGSSPPLTFTAWTSSVSDQTL